MLIFRLRVLILLVFVTSSFSASATIVDVNVSDLEGTLISDAVVELIPEHSMPSSAINNHEMRQQNRIFQPFVLAVQQGDKVNFPNFDRTRHHVYSFSPAKPFELKLYVGKAEEPIEFAQPGIVAIGCNIHDYMQAFIYVAQSPLYAVSDNKGHVSFNDLIPGTYNVKIWHPWQKVPVIAAPIVLTGETKQTLELQFDIEHQDKPTSPQAGFALINQSTQIEFANAT
ncbi:methylamine utilization protein [Shewanella sp. OMA3-2]|uniref:methylamine utilization protein n=1 Tax=Shewanella sp. OMA3-2 TaxID=2908650 RepID=UPI001F1C5DC3|nr:methylamine utilization protein [Shewanella sp. OMA3-2]UJF22368.1 methylamine utilization protein [Shewanella sp. OMA3-2]